MFNHPTIASGKWTTQGLQAKAGNVPTKYPIMLIKTSQETEPYHLANIHFMRSTWGRQCQWLSQCTMFLIVSPFKRQCPFLASTHTCPKVSQVNAGWCCQQHVFHQVYTILYYVAAPPAWERVAACFRLWCAHVVKCSMLRMPHTIEECPTPAKLCLMWLVECILNVTTFLKQVKNNHAAASLLLHSTIFSYILVIR